MEEHINWKTQQLIGKPVYNTDKELLGHIVDLEVVPGSGRIGFIELVIDEVEPARSVFVPWSQVQIDQDGNIATAPFRRRFLESISQPRCSS
ncbi:MAG: PRC-barrel domain-containing protein [Gammaproteobacteria bacterium]|nr:PRC-barrel domain-containing protein [Gammaproteobacteria bacterium]NNF61794.1 PRC-barrel domain-containing protein [Gammaproteobacteria bacterium]NNM19718.1 PRC-barrel domain-containing protein [Gammaproteobacteria bacterium]